MSQIDPSQKTLVEQLRALAGVSADTNEFVIVKEEGRTIHVRFSPGSTDSLDVKTLISEQGSSPRFVQAGYRNGRREGPLLVPRPMNLVLRKETAANRQGKADGVDREIQTDDPAFDDAVFIDTLINDDLVRALLASPDARAAILSLLGDNCAVIRIDDSTAGNISLDLVEFTQPAPDQQRGARIVDALARLAASLPPIRASGEAPPVDNQSAAATTGCVFAFLGLIGTPMAVYGLAPSGCVESDGEGSSLVCGAGPQCCEPLWTGFFVGLLLSLPVIAFLHRIVRGKPNSSTSRFVLQCATLVVFAELGLVASRLWR
ncbi:hypothetical protein KEG38_54360 [Polyangium jinanense]|uniref:hypothetical protein n=1 Tax=Polyangium jinanense TaxID=2829994 RepID=UPI0023418696|nr:hypothetical protein [Polyangium jinanense]MDC3962907.1 hypothetical protein [Polyangium jinanense]